MIGILTECLKISLWSLNKKKNVLLKVIYLYFTVTWLDSLNSDLR